MSPLEDVEDEEYIAPKELTLVGRRALSVQVKEDEALQRETFSILGVMFKAKYAI